MYNYVFNSDFNHKSTINSQLLHFSLQVFLCLCNYECTTCREEYVVFSGVRYKVHLIAMFWI